MRFKCLETGILALYKVKTLTIFMSKSFSPIISTHDAGLYLTRLDVVLADARGGPDAFERYQSGHLLGAVFINLEKDLSKRNPIPANGGRHPLPDPGDFSKFLSRMGINPSKYVLIYDDKAGANAAARFWWMMKAAGHNKVQVIDGGYQAILEAGLPTSKQIHEPLPFSRPYAFSRWKLPVVDIKTVAQAATENGSLVIDVREAYRYNGEREPIDLIAGHIPGAVNVPYEDNLEADGRFRSPQALAAQYQAVIGNRDKKKIIVHCGSGVTACHSLLAMEYAGIAGVSLYVGSWSEWSRNEKPMATGVS